MALSDRFNLEALLAPIPGDLPQGIDLREDFTARSPYSRLRDARSGARDAEKQLEAPAPDAPPPDPAPLWRILHDLGVQMLTEKTKDLETAAWVTEALVRSDGLAGLAAGSRLIAGLADRYWNDIYPLPDDYGMETRVAPITGLNGRDGGGSLMGPMYRIVLFSRSDGSAVPLHQYEASAKLETIEPAARQQRIASGTIPFDDIEKDARTIGRASMVKLRADATDALAAWEHMTAILDEKAGPDAPSTSHVRNRVREILDIASRYAPDAAPPPEPTIPATVAMGGARHESVVTSPAQGMTRESALQNLEAIAAFFRRTEPHSPLSYTLDEAVRRARLPWLDLLTEVMGDQGSRDAFLTNLGIRPPPPPE